MITLMKPVNTLNILQYNLQYSEGVARRKSHGLTHFTSSSKYYAYSHCSCPVVSTHCLHRY